MKSKLFSNGIVVLLGAVLFAVIPLVNGGVPSREHLIEVSGPLTSLTPSTSGKNGLPVRFSLQNDSRTFQYLSIGKEMMQVEQALRSAGSKVIRILIDPKDQFEYPTAYEVQVGERMIRPYAEVSAAFERNNRLSWWTACVLAVVGAGMMGLAYLRR